MAMSEAGRQALSERTKAKRAAGFNPRRIYRERLQERGNHAHKTCVEVCQLPPTV